MRTYSSLRAPYLPSFPPCPTISRAYLATSAVFYPLAPVVHARHGLYVIRRLVREKEREGGRGRGFLVRPKREWKSVLGGHRWWNMEARYRPHSGIMKW